MKDELSLKIAEDALGRGDYGQCLELLQRLALENPLPSQKGAEIRMLMITAYMGQGDDQRAISTCRLLTQSRDSEFRSRAKQLLSILEAPSLQRPENWSIQLPEIDLVPQTDKNPYRNDSNHYKTESTPLPATGPTRDLGIGFSTFVIAILTILTILLSGCVQITTKIQLPQPEKINLIWDIESISKKILPWQTQFKDSLKEQVPAINIISNSEGKQKISALSLEPEKANLLFQKIIFIATKTAGIELSSPQLILKENNWVIGVQQNIKVIIDLRELPEIPGLSLKIVISPSKNNGGIQGHPLQASATNSEVFWDLQQGDINELSLHAWRWSRVGIGSLTILLLMTLALLLQRIRLQMGFGFPELPP